MDREAGMTYPRLFDLVAIVTKEMTRDMYHSGLVASFAFHAPDKLKEFAPASTGGKGSGRVDYDQLPAMLRPTKDKS